MGEKGFDFHRLQIFIEVARRGSFTQAALDMRLSVAAVSRAIARLEHDIDVRLFNRTTRRVNLTTDGAMFLAEVTAGLDRLYGAKDVLHAQHQRVSGSLKVLLPNTFAKHYIMPELPHFLERYPNLELEIYIEDFAIDLLSGGFDLALQFGRPPTTGYIMRNLGKLDILLVASPRYLERYGVPRTVEDLKSHQCINTRGTHGDAPFDWHLEPRDKGGPISVHRPSGQCFINSQLDGAIFAAVHGVGIAPSDVKAVERFIRAGELKVVLPNYRVFYDGDMMLLYPHRDHLALKTRAFINFAIDVAQHSLPGMGIDPFAFAA